MVFGMKLGCSDSSKYKERKTMATTATNYWNATAFEVMQQMQQPKSAKTTEREEEERWNQHKFGLCLICKKGLDDKADFTFDYSTGSECGMMMCFECYAKRQPKKTCSNCAAQVEDKEVMVCGWDWRTSKTTVFRCSKCD